MRQSRQHYLRHKEAARDYIHERLTHWNRFYGCNLRKVFIKNHRSRWGSCSSKGNLNFNYRLLFLPPQLADYIVVHELCHLRHMNHSKKFWELVAVAMPDHKELRKELRTLTMQIMRQGKTGRQYVEQAEVLLT